MYNLCVAAVGHEGLFKGRVKYFVARLGLIFVNELVAPVDAREQRFTVGVSERR